MSNLIGERIRQLRIKCGLGQKELAEKVGVSSQKISNWERNYTKSLGGEYIAKLSEALGTSSDYLFRGILTPEEKMKFAIGDNPELLEFFNDIKKRPELKLLFKQIKPLEKETIKRIIKYIQLVENEEGENKARQP